MRAAYRLGIDIGTNSLGWCVLDLDRNGRPRGIRRMGVRIFSDGRNPQSGTSLAVERRVPRQQRRRRDRYLDRRGDLMNALVRHGLMPADETERKKLESLDPYALRARGLDEPLPLHHFGRALFHLNQRRGFKSNRKTDKAEDEKEAKGIKGAIAALDRRMQDSGARTLGEYLYRTCREGRNVRATLPVRARKRGVGARAEYDLYPSRAMYEAEFDALWAAQASHRPELSDAARDEIRDIIFYQRPLKPVDPGKCTLDPTDRRAPEALPIAQRFRMYQELANLKIEPLGEPSRFLDRAERDRVFAKLERVKELSFDRIRAILGLGSAVRFNLESERRKGLKGDATGTKLSKKGAFGPRWWNLAEEKQNEIVETLLSEENEERLLATATGDWGLSEEAARAVAEMRLPEGFARFGRRALAKIVPLLEARGFEGYGLADAAMETYGHRSDFRTGEILDALPYYGAALERHVAWGTGEPADPAERRYGRIANPTVHIGLNQLRKVVNALIADYGHPAEIVVELGRDLKLGKKDKERIQKEQNENHAKNEARRAKLAELGQVDNAENRLRLRLWEELNPAEPHNRRCPYTGEQISIHRLFSPEVEIEHILPFKRTLDNSPANRTVSLRYANRAKGNLSPHEAFGHSPTIDGRRYDWDGILARSADLPKNKRWRFQPDAMDRFEAERDFLDRQLIDTQYLARITKEYLTRICDPNRVWVTPGRLTEMLRGKWGLNQLLWDHNLKKRVDHRHHAIDAFVIGVTDRALLQRIASAADQHRERLIDDMPEPWDGFREELEAKLKAIVVSHKPDHGSFGSDPVTGRSRTSGRLHEDTAYGIVGQPEREDGATLVSRKPLEELNVNEIARIRDRQLRAKLQSATASCNGDAAALKKALAQFGAENGIRRVRLLKKEELFIPIKHAAGRYSKAYVPGDNHRIDIIALPDGRWAGEAVTTFAANQKTDTSGWRQTHPDATLVMTVHKGDLLKLDVGGQDTVMRVVRLEPSAGRLRLAAHVESGDLQKRHSDKDDPFRWTFVSFNQLKARRARKVTVDVLGRVRDPGPRP